MKSLLVAANFAALLALSLAGSSLKAEPILWIDDDAGRLGRVDVATGAVTVVGNMGVVMTDIAFAPNGDLYGLSFTDLYRINPATAAATLIGPTGIPGGNALVFAADGTLYGAGNSTVNLFTINPATGAATSPGFVGTFSAGDLAFVNGMLYMSTTSNNLIRIALSPAFGATTVGPIGFANVFGLATPDNNALYGVTNTQILAIDVTTGIGAPVVNYAGGGLSGAFGSSFVTEATVPEPASLLAATLGIVASAGVLRRRVGDVVRHRPRASI